MFPRFRFFPLALIIPVLLATAVAMASSLDAQEIHQERGVDARVDYASLTRIGPWDDRNYQLLLEDLAELRPDEQRFRDPIPAFFRVGLRRAEKQQAEARQLDPSRLTGYYPMHAVPSFRLTYGGFLVDGQLYRGAEYREGRFVITSRPFRSHEDFLRQKAFGGEVLVNAEAAESAVKIHPNDPQRVIAGSNGPGGNEMHYSSDGGATWTETALPLGNTCCDPTVDWNASGTFAHTATLGNCVLIICDILYYRSGDSGQTWTDLEDETPGDPRRELGTGDKEFLHVDRSPASPHQDNIYVSWHFFNEMRIARSSDGGDTWSTVVHSGDPSGIGSDVTTDRLGNVYHFYPTVEGEGDSRIVLKQSSDGGATYDAGVMTVGELENEFNFFIPINDQRGVATIVTATTDLSGGGFDDSLYAAWTDTTGADTQNPSTTHARIRFAFARDASSPGDPVWTVLTPHPTVDALTVDRFHPWLAVGSDGRVWLAFYETLAGDREQLHFVYTSSDDGGVTWAPTTPLTTQTSGDPNDDFEWGDYNGLDVVGDQLVSIFTDNRDESGGGAATSLDVYAVGLSTIDAEIFDDGFEAGDTSAWSESFP